MYSCGRLSVSAVSVDGSELCTAMYSNVQLWTEMYSYGRLCTAMDGYVQLWTAMYSYGWLRTAMDSKGQLWTTKNCYGRLCTTDGCTQLVWLGKETYKDTICYLYMKYITERAGKCASRRHCSCFRCPFYFLGRQFRQISLGMLAVSLNFV